MRVTMLGTSAAVPTVERGVPALMVQRESEHLLFDCGEGTQRQMMRYGGGFSFDHLFFSHYHADHTLGLPGLLRTLGLQGRVDPLHLYGPQGAEKQLGALVALGVEREKFPVLIHSLAPGDQVEMPGFMVRTASARHKGASLAYALIEPPRLGRFDPDRARALGVPEGPLWGRMHRGESVTLADGRVVAPIDLVGPTRPGRKLVYSGDTAPCAGVTELAEGADLLIHEATFGEDERARARETLHSTARSAAITARDAGARKLLLTHISARYSREAPELLAEAGAIFPETCVARDGMVLEVGFTEGVGEIDRQG